MDGPPGRAAVIGASVLGATLIAGVGLLFSRRRNPLVGAEHLDEVWDTIRSTCGPPSSPPGLTTTTKGMAVAVSPLEPGWHVSFSHPKESTLEVALALGGTVVRVSDRVVQIVIEPAWSSTATTPCDDSPRSAADAVVASGVPDGYFTAPSATAIRQWPNLGVGKIVEHGRGGHHHREVIPQRIAA